MKIFITGGSGTLGQYLNLELNGKHDILTQFNSNLGNCGSFNSEKLSIEDYGKLEKVFSSFRPDVVIHTASVSNAEKADRLAADVVYDINVNATQVVSELCDRYKAKLIYTSSDLVYAGYRGSMLKEDSKLIPVSLYAETKLMGEVKIQQTFGNYVILRMALMFGLGLNHSRNHFHFMFDELRNGRTVKLFTDQFRTPVALKDASRMISDLIEKNISGEVINLGGNERVSRYNLGEILCEEVGLDKNLLIATTMDEMGVPYKVADVSMNTEKLNSYGVKSKSVRESINEIVKRF
ncbi:MAG: NAD(P)-dependent oxidoreductase [Bacteroidetes bacterium]|nr:NAD(P)-dependent oxidoreductase [Bacteroidota bacterium]